MTEPEGPDTLHSQIDGVRAEAEREFERLRAELTGPRDLPSARDADSITEQIALRQEIDTLRHTLREKERLVETTAAQCRRLEDELEDQQVAYDELKQDLERKKHSLAAAREYSTGLARKREAIEERYQALLGDLGHAQGLCRGAAAGAAPRLRTAWFLVDARFLGGLLLGIVTVLVVLVLLRPDLLSFARVREPIGPEPPTVTGTAGDEAPSANAKKPVQAPGERGGESWSPLSFGRSETPFPGEARDHR